MINSMTGFARSHDQGDWGSAVWEIRSVNHRYLDPVFRLPEALFLLEEKLRKYLRDYIKRGRIECRLQFHAGPTAGEQVVVNAPLVNALATAAQQTAELAACPADVRAIELLRWPGVVAIAETKLEQISQPLLDLFKATLSDLVQIRRQEGQALIAFMEQHLAEITAKVKQLRVLQPKIIEKQRERLLSHFREACVELNAERLTHEMVAFAQKIDVAEELNRIQIHTEEVGNLLKKQAPVGRKLDFLLQELNREVNTLAAKSVEATVTSIAVDMKVFIEQMREQTQNIE